MNCVGEGMLRACLDDELSSAARQEIMQHLSQCALCQQRWGEIERSAMLAKERLTLLSPADGRADVQLALASTRRRAEMQSGSLTRIYRRLVMGTERKVWRPILVGALILALFVGVYSFAPTRTIARQLLSIFRVRKFAVIEINPDEAQIEEIGRALEDNLFITEPEVIVDEPVVSVASIEEARELAGFDVRVPGYIPDDETPRFSVKGHSEYAFRFTREGLEMFLELAGMDPNRVPDGLDEGVVTIAMPAVVEMRTSRLSITQAWNPTIEYPEGIDTSLFGEAGLRLFGLSPRKAKRISKSIDWTNTLVLPVPADVADFSEIEVAGEDAVLVRPRHRDDYNRPTLFLEKDDVIYVIAGRHSLDQIIQIAVSMF